MRMWDLSSILKHTKGSSHGAIREESKRGSINSLNNVKNLKYKTEVPRNVLMFTICLPKKKLVYLILCHRRILIVHIWFKTSLRDAARRGLLTSVHTLTPFIMPKGCVSNATHSTVDKRKQTDASTPIDLTTLEECVTNATVVGTTTQSGP